MKNRMMNRVVNKYILHNRSIFFSNDDEVKHFLEKRSIENSKKHQQPATLNVKSNLDKLTLNDMQVFRFNFRHEKIKRYSICMVDIILCNLLHFIGDF